MGQRGYDGPPKELWRVLEVGKGLSRSGGAAKVMEGLTWGPTHGKSRRERKGAAQMGCGRT